MSRMKVTMVKKNEEGQGSLRAICDVDVAGLVTIHGVRLIEGKNGMFVSMPSDKWVNNDGVTRYSEIVSADSNEIKEEILKALINQYEVKPENELYTEEERAFFENLQ